MVAHHYIAMYIANHMELISREADWPSIPVAAIVNWPFRVISIFFLICRFYFVSFGKAKSSIGIEVRGAMDYQKKIYTYIKKKSSISRANKGNKQLNWMIVK